MMSTEAFLIVNNTDHLTAGLAYIDLRVRWAVVRARVHGLNPDDEFRGLYISEEHVDRLLDQAVGANLWPSPNGSRPELAQWPLLINQARQEWVQAIYGSDAVDSPLRCLVQTFGLSAEALDVFLLALAPELDPRYERLFSYLQDDVTKKRPSVNLALDMLTESFSEKLRLQSLFADDQPLIAQRLLTRFHEGGQREPTLLAETIRPTTAVLAYLLGQKTIDKSLEGIATLVETTRPYEQMMVSQQSLAQLGAVLPHQPFYGLVGSYGSGKKAVAYALAHMAGRPLLRVDAAALLNDAQGMTEKLQLIERDGRLHEAVLFFAQWDALLHDGQPLQAAMERLLAYPHPVIASGEQPWQPRYRTQARPLIQLQLPVPDYKARLAVWEYYIEKLPANMLSEEAIDTQAVASHFRFTPGQIRDAVATAHDLALWQQEAVTTDHLLAASRTHSNQQLSALATKVKPRYTWQDIILPDDSLAQLKEMVNVMERQTLVYNEWGFGQKLAIGKGLKALFAGEPGTGKTMSADILAYELGLDLYKIDLSTVVDKYIGETEKNIGRIFDEATTSNAILFFDEADSLFGKRSDVKDSHDRHANIQTGYLLQRMEAFDGVVILATNLRSNIDEAFTRRLHFVVEFPFPEVADRERIWRVMFPEEVPLDGAIDFRLLAERFRLAGGNIRNIVLAAAFLAAEQDDTVRMHHILHAARREYQKMGRLINESLFT